MSTTDRPGGLTALAVINFVFTGLDLIYAVILAAGIAVIMALSAHPANGPGTADQPLGITTTSESGEDGEHAVPADHIATPGQPDAQAKPGPDSAVPAKPNAHETPLVPAKDGVPAKTDVPVSGGPPELDTSSDQAAKKKGLAKQAKIIKDNLASLCVGVATSAVCAVLLLLSGIGYLRQSRVMGRYIGSLYAVASLTGTTVNTVLAGEHISIMIIIVLIYPLLTLGLVNLSFKDDLVN